MFHKKEEGKNNISSIYYLNIFKIFNITIRIVQRILNKNLAL